MSKQGVKTYLYCLWCGHEDYYYIAKYDQPRCKSCLRFVKKTNVTNEIKGVEGMARRVVKNIKDTKI